MSSEIQGKQSTEKHSASRLEQLPGILRVCGVIAVLLSLYGFFVKGWEGSDDLMRFLMLFGHTLALAGLGLLSGHLLKEGKGARVLIMLALVSVVANFSILGSFLYAEYGQSLSQNFIPAMRWSIDNAWLTVALAMSVPIILTPVVIVAITILSRGMSNNISLLFLSSNALLLLPFRDPFFIAIVGTALAAYTLFFVAKNHRQRIEAKTFEGKFALLIQFLPLMVLLVRNIWLYDDITVLYASMCTVGFIALRQFSIMLTFSSSIRSIMDIASTLLALALAACLMDVIRMLLHIDAMTISLPCIVSAVLLYELSTRANIFIRFYRNFSIVVMTSGVLFNLLIDTSVLSTLITILSSVALAYCAYTTKHRTMLFAACVLMLSACINMTWNLWFSFDIDAWFLCAFVGILTIISGSIIETKGPFLNRMLSLYHKTFQNLPTHQKNYL